LSAAGDSSGGAAGRTPAGGDTAAQLHAGRVGRSHGLDGSFYVTAATPRLLALGSRLTVAGRAATIVRRAGTDRHPIVRLEGVADRDAARALKGLPLTVAGQQAPALAEGEWWAHELEGCDVFDGEQLIGTVSRLIELPSCEALEVKRTAGGPPLLVPMVKDALRSVQPQQRRIEVEVSFLDVSGESRQPRARRKAGPRDGD
jgi:16S rRNA processing protein RimM